MRRTALIVTLVAALAACSSETSGTASPMEPTSDGDVPAFPETSTPVVEETTTEPSETEPATADLEPCELLTVDELTALGLPSEPLDQGKLGPARHCQWQTSGSHTVTVGIMDDLGIDEVVSESPPRPMTVGSHDAVQYEGLGGTCGVTIAVTNSTRVDVLGIAGGDLAKGCAHANQAAELVEPKLP